VLGHPKDSEWVAVVVGDVAMDVMMSIRRRHVLGDPEDSEWVAVVVGDVAMDVMMSQ